MSTFKDFAVGLSTLFRGFVFLLRNPRLWLMALAPTVINLIVLGAMIGVFVHYYGDVYAWLSTHLVRLGLQNADTWYLQALAAVLWVLDAIFQAFIILLSLILLLILSYAVGLTISAPFNDALSEKTETILTGAEPPPFSLSKLVRESARTIKIEALKSLVFVAIPCVLFILNFIPVAGGILYTFFTILFGAMDLGFSFADLPMGRRVLPLKTRLDFARANKWGLAGLGIGFMVPFFALIFSAPMAVAGAIFYVEHKDLSSQRPPTEPFEGKH